MFHCQRFPNITACLLMLAATAGCESRPTVSAPVAKPPAAAAQPKQGSVVTPVVKEASQQPPDREYWSAIYMQDRKVGYSHVAVRKVTEDGQELVHTQNDSELTIVRERDALTQQLQLQSWETPAGELHRFESRMTSGTGEITAQGRLGNGGMIVTTNTLGKKVTTFVPLPEKCGGYFAADQSLETKPLKAGDEIRIIAAIVPIFNTPGEVQLTPLDEEEVSIRGLTQKLLKVKNEIKIAGQTLTTFCWINDRGETLRTFDPTFKQESFLTTKEIALQKQDLGKIDLLAATTAKLTGEKMPEERPLPQAVYLAKLTDGQEIAGQFATDEFQQFEPIDEHTGRLKIKVLDRSSPVDEKLRGEKPVPADSAPNSLIQSDDPAVIQLAASVLPDENDPLTLVSALEKSVRQHIHKRGYAQAFATAAEVARSHEGDCTEHAVLLAAVCRARRIPARVVLGLVYYPPQQGFAYHMWNEVWIGERWLPLDATVAQGVVGADHIKLRHANLQGESAYAVMLPLLAVVGRLELEVVATK